MFNLENFQNKFLTLVDQKTLSLILSYVVFGSVARGKGISKDSDIDTVLVTKKDLSFEELTILGNYMCTLDNELGHHIDNIIVSKDEVYNILSPNLLLSAYRDGYLLYGSDIREDFYKYLKAMNQSALINGLLSTLSLKRHWHRKFILNKNSHNLSTSNLNYLTKAVVHRARDYVAIVQDPFIKDLDKSLEIFENIFDDPNTINLPRICMDLRLGKQTIEEEKYSELLRDSYHFIELITKLCEKKYLEVSGEKEVKLKVF